MTAAVRLGRLAAAGAAAAALLLASTGTLSGYWRFLLTEVAVLALLATSFNVVYGFGGMLSFCQGTFYGLGAYLAAWLALGAAVPPLAALPLALAGGGLAGLLVGLLLVRLGGHALTIASVIVAVVGVLVGNTFREVTGGEDGLTIAARVGPGLAVGPWPPGLVALHLAAGTLAVVLGAAALVLRSTPGKVLLAIRENEVRARFLGYRVRRWRLGLFTAGGALAALAGAIYAITAGHVSTATLEIGLSVNAILWTVVGGLGTVTGPLLGVALLLPVTDLLSTRLAALAQIPVGVLLILVITLMPNGVLGWLRDHRRPDPTPSPAGRAAAAAAEAPGIPYKEVRS